MKLNLYTKEKDKANQFLVDYLGQNYADSFSVAKKYNNEEVYVCSGNISDDDASVIGSLIPEYINEVDNFDGFTDII